MMSKFRSFLVLFFLFCFSCFAFAADKKIKIGEHFARLESPRSNVTLSNPSYATPRSVAPVLRFAGSTRASMRFGRVRGMIFSDQRVEFLGCALKSSSFASMPSSRPVSKPSGLQLHVGKDNLKISIDGNTFLLKTTLSLSRIKQIAHYISSSNNAVVTLPLPKHRLYKVKNTGTCTMLRKKLGIYFPLYHPAFLEDNRHAKDLVRMDLLPGSLIGAYEKYQNALLLGFIFYQKQEDKSKSLGFLKKINESKPHFLHFFPKSLLRDFSRISSWAIHNLERKDAFRVRCRFDGKIELNGLPSFTFHGEEKSKKNEIYSEIKEFSEWFEINQTKIFCKSKTCDPVYLKLLEFYRLQTFLRYVKKSYPKAFDSFYEQLKLEKETPKIRASWFFSKEKDEDHVWIKPFLSICVEPVK